MSDRATEVAELMDSPCYNGVSAQPDGAIEIEIPTDEISEELNRMMFDFDFVVANVKRVSDEEMQTQRRQAELDNTDRPRIISTNPEMRNEQRQPEARASEMAPTRMVVTYKQTTDI